MEKQASLRKLKRAEKKICQILKIGPATSEILFLSKKEMFILKRKFFKKFSRADVLSFAEPKNFPHPDYKERVLGQIFINWNVAKSDFNALLKLFIHGFLHTLGYNHFKKNDIIKMERTEKRLLRNLL